MIANYWGIMSSWWIHYISFECRRIFTTREVQLIGKSLVWLHIYAWCFFWLTKCSQAHKYSDAFNSTRLNWQWMNFPWSEMKNKPTYSEHSNNILCFATKSIWWVCFVDVSSMKWKIMQITQSNEQNAWQDLLQLNTSNGSIQCSLEMLFV